MFLVPESTRDSRERYVQTSKEKKKSEFIRKPMLIQGELVERTETILMHFKWEGTWTHENQPKTFQMGQRVNSHFEKKTAASSNERFGVRPCAKNLYHLIQYRYLSATNRAWNS